MKTLFTALFNLASLPLFGYLLGLIWCREKSSFLTKLVLSLLAVGGLISISGWFSTGELHLAPPIACAIGCILVKLIFSSDPSERTSPSKVITSHRVIDLNSSSYIKRSDGSFIHQYGSEDFVIGSHNHLTAHDDPDETGYSPTHGYYTIE